MELSVIIPHIEALVFASEKALPTLDIVELVNNALGFIEDRATLDQVEAALAGIREKYDSEFYPFEVKESGGGWQFLTKPAYHNTIAQLNGDKFMKRLSSAALETLSIIAYKQPITKSEIEFIRGVNCDYAVQKLLEKELVIITGRREDAVGHPLVYATSKNFMDYFGINSPDELPKLTDITTSDLILPSALTEQRLVESDANDEVAAYENDNEGEDPTASGNVQAGDDAAVKDADAESITLQIADDIGDGDAEEAESVIDTDEEISGNDGNNSDDADAESSTEEKNNPI